MSEEDIREHLGLVQVYTGNSKGKTTASLGLALRALGNGLKVAMVQFMKPPRVYGEYEMAKSLPNFTLLPMGRPSLVHEDRIRKEDYEAAEAALRKAEEIIQSRKYDMVILDEACVTVHMGLLKVEDVLRVVKSRPPHMEIVLTGRYCPSEIIEIADLVTEMRQVKHPYEKGIPARRGIES
ncbi:MAG: cob(I)yrinic acid a,c-diamide adenosyltransferase [Candidatus Saccharibacteria bacterium]